MPTDLLAKLPKDCIITGIAVLSISLGIDYAEHNKRLLDISEVKKEISESHRTLSNKEVKHHEDHQERITEIERAVSKIGSSLDSIQSDTRFIKEHFLREGLSGE